MKTILVIAATLGFSATAAFAECPYAKVTASVDTELTTASIVKSETAPAAEADALTVLPEQGSAEN